MWATTSVPGVIPVMVFQLQLELQLVIFIFFSLVFITINLFDIFQLLLQLLIQLLNANTSDYTFNYKHH